MLRRVRPWTIMCMKGAQRMPGAAREGSRFASARRRRARPPGVPSFRDALAALLGDRPEKAAAMFAARALAYPADKSSRRNRAIALYEAGRWAEAAPLFEQFIAEDGCAADESVPYLFSLGLCRLELGDAIGSLLATTAFLDLWNERHPWYWEGLHNTACAWERLGAEAEAATLIHVVRAHEGLEEPRLPTTARSPCAWPRRMVIARSFAMLGLDAKPRPRRRIEWRG